MHFPRVTWKVSARGENCAGGRSEREKYPVCEDDLLYAHADKSDSGSVCRRADIRPQQE